MTYTTSQRKKTLMERVTRHINGPRRTALGARRVPLRDVSALHEWRGRTEPPLWIWHAVRDWVGRLGDRPGQFPSIPFPDLSRPEYEVRTAYLSAETGVDAGGVRIRYRRELETNAIDLLWLMGPDESDKS